MINNLFSRCSRLIKSNLYAIFEKIENADSKDTLTRSIADIDAVIEEIKSELGRTAAIRHRTKQKRQTILHRHHDLDLQIKSALKKNMDAEASNDINQQIEIETEIASLDTTLTKSAEETQTLEAYLNALKSKKEILTNALTQINYRKSKTDLNGQQDDFSADTDRVLKEKIINAEQTFERLMSKHAPNYSINQSNAGASKQLQELEKIALDTKIKERLNKAKRGIVEND